MNKILLLFIILSVLNVKSQKLNWVQEHPLVENGFHWGNTVATDNMGNIYCSSILRKPEFGTLIKKGSYIRKYNGNGILLWENFKPRAEIFGLTTDKKGNVILSGDFTYDLDFGCGTLSDSAGRPFFLSKLDSNGNCLWTKEFKSAYIGQIRFDKVGDAVYVVGGGNGYHQNFGCASFQNQYYQFVAKYDAATGNCMWLQPIFNQANIMDLALNKDFLAITGRFHYKAYFGMDSSFVFGVDSSGYLSNVYTALYDLDGNLQWAKVTADRSDDASGNSIALDDSSNVYLTGNFYDKMNLAGKYYHVSQWKDIFVIKYNKFGDTLMTATWPGLNSEEGRALHVTKDGVYFSGLCFQQLAIADTVIKPAKSTIVLAKLTHDLKKVQWVKTLTNNSADRCEIFKITSDNYNNILVCGDYTDNLKIDSVQLTYNNNGFLKPFVASFKELNPAVSVKDVPIQNTGFAIYPNPTDGHLSITCSSEINTAELNIKNILGQTVYSKNISTTKGEFSTSLNLSAYPKGIYFVELRSENFREVKKIVRE